MVNPLPSFLRRPLRISALRQLGSGRVATLLLGILCLMVPMGSHAQDEPAAPMILEIEVPDNIGSPNSISVDDDGKVWFAEKVGKNLVGFDPELNEFEIHALPSDWGNVGPSRIALAPDGSIWFTVSRWANSEDVTWYLGQLEPATGTFRRYILVNPNPPGGEDASEVHVTPDDLLIDQNGTVWFLSPDDNNVYSFMPETEGLQGYPIPTPNSYPKGIAIASSGAIWFTQANANKIARFVPSTAAFSEYPIPTPFANPETLSVDGMDRVWFVELRTNRLSAFYPEDERFYEASIPTSGGLPNAIEADIQGGIWFLEYLGNKVGVFDPVSAQFKEFVIPTFSSLPSDLAIDDSRDRLWFSQSSTEAKRLGMLSLSKARAHVVSAELAGATRSATKSGSTRRNDLILAGALGALIILLSCATFVFWRRGRQ